MNAYLQDGFGAQIYSSYYIHLLHLAAVMYVKDTNLVHWSCIPSCTPAELIAAAQTVTYAWEGLAIATGAAMNLINVTLIFCPTGLMAVALS